MFDSHARDFYGKSHSWGMWSIRYIIYRRLSASLSKFIYIISSVMHIFWLVLTYDLLEDRHINDAIIKNFFLILYYIKQIDSKLPCVCSVIDHRGCQNVVRTSVPHVPLFCSYHVLTSSVIYNWRDVQQLGIYLLNGATDLFELKG